MIFVAFFGKKKKNKKKKKKKKKEKHNQSTHTKETPTLLKSRLRHVSQTDPSKKPRKNWVGCQSGRAF
jgi:hypothetical protein